MASASASATLAAALLGGVTGCAVLGSTTTATSGEACADWVTFKSPAEAASGAGVVLRGSVVERDGTARFFGVDAHRWLFDVEEVLERPAPANDVEPRPEVEVSPGERVAVVSTPETCTAGGLYPGGDPLDPATGLGDADGSVIVLLVDGDGQGGEGELHLITPFQGVLTPDLDGSLPAGWLPE
ncbi:hypothetical protein [Promicromonospora sp. NPDC023805]|uniref:hypothetical protein n=1 Tax=Promicromonospora sp. NPDC023805 TaxID=3154696 RepID=UPI0033FC78EC